MFFQRIFILFFICMLPLLTDAQQFGGNPPSIEWKQFNTKDARVIFPNGTDSQARRMAYLIQLLNQKNGSRQKKWNVLLQYHTTIPNAYVRMAPVMSEMYMTPPQDNFSLGSLRWDDNLVIHESRHMQQFSRFNNGLTKLFSFFLGEDGQLLANGMSIPDYFFEGDAIWQETIVSKQGRGRLPNFYNGFKSLWLERKNYSWMKTRSGSLKDYLPDHYALGYLMVAYGYETYGQDFWEKVTSDAVRFRGLIYPFNKAIERHSGKKYKQFRDDAFDYFRNKFVSIRNDQDTKNQLTTAQKNNVTDYLFPNCIGDDSIIVTKRSYKEPGSFYLIQRGKETKIREKDISIDDYYSCNKQTIVYVAYASDKRYGNRDYSDIRMIDIKKGTQRNLTNNTKYFSPDINKNGTEVLAVQVSPDGRNALHRINATDGHIVFKLPNDENYFFTHPKYISDYEAVSAIRRPDGNMSIATVNLQTGHVTPRTPFSMNVVGYPSVQSDTIVFNAMQPQADQVFALTLSDNKIFRVTSNTHAVYYPAMNNKGNLFVSTFTANGYMLTEYPSVSSGFESINPESFAKHSGELNMVSFQDDGSSMLDTLQVPDLKATPIKRSFRLLNLHSRRPVADDPEFGYAFYTDNILSSFSGNLTYTYNRNEKSHTIGANALYAGIFPLMGIGAEASFNRNIDTALGKSVNFNSAKWVAGISVPLQWVKGRYSRFLSVSGSYNNEQLYYRGIGKNIFTNQSFTYLRSAFSYFRAGRQARQHINPRWAQSVSAIYRKSFSNPAYHKFTSNNSFYFPGFFINHSFVVNASFQQRDSFPDLFSNTFSYSRGYDALSTRRMFKWGINYHLPLLYPDWGFGNILFCQRIRTNIFYDHTTARARVNGNLTDIINRSTGAEIYFDNKLWNSLPLSFGVRYAHLLDRNLRNPSVKNRWEIVLPIGIIPN